MTEILECPLIFTVVNTVVVVAVYVGLGAGLFHEPILKAATTGVLMGLVMSITMVYLRRSDATEY